MKRLAILSVMLLVGAGLTLIPFHTNAADTLQQRAKRLDEKIRAAEEDSLSWGEAVGVLALHGALLGFELSDGQVSRAVEGLLLMIPGAKERRVLGDHVAQEPLVAAILPEILAMAGTHGQAARRLPTETGRPLLISAERRSDGSVEVQAVREVTYLPESEVLLGEIPLPSTPFWALQERGWLHPYRMTWTWMVSAHEVRQAIESQAASSVAEAPKTPPL